MAYGLPVWNIALEVGEDEPRVRRVRANCFEAAVKGALHGYTYHNPDGPRVQDYRLLGVEQWNNAPTFPH